MNQTLMLVSVLLLIVGLTLNAVRFVNRKKNRRAAAVKTLADIAAQDGRARVGERKTLVSDMKTKHPESNRRERRGAAIELQRRLKARMQMEARG